MIAETLNIFLNNSVGRLAEVTEILGKAGVNLKDLSLSESNDFGILRLLTDDNRRAFEVLDSAGFAVTLSKVVILELGDNPGELSRLIRKLSESQISIENLSAFSIGEKACMVIRVADAEACERLLTE